jgi:hypothetical protein
VNTRISKGGAIAMITTIRSIGQFSAENFNDVLSENCSLLAQANTSIAEALRISKTVIKQRYKCSIL